MNILQKDERAGEFKAAQISVTSMRNQTKTRRASETGVNFARISEFARKIKRNERNFAIKTQSGEGVLAAIKRKLRQRIRPKIGGFRRPDTARNGGCVDSSVILPRTATLRLKFIKIR